MDKTDATTDSVVSADTKLELLVAHYDNTFENVLAIQKRRDRLFLWTMVFVVLLLLRLAAPDEIDALLAEIVRDRLGSENAPNVSVLGSVVWFAILGFVVRYFQTVVHNERYLVYLHGLEDRLKTHYDGFVFTREGESYLKPYPTFSRWTWFLYTISFPVLLLLITSLKIFGELRNGFSIVLLFNSFAYVALVISIVLYMLVLHWKR